MKPIRLTMQAFGSYGEKTEIDFQKGGDFFLISGDTGSGKSTIQHKRQRQGKRAAEPVCGRAE